MNLGKVVPLVSPTPYLLTRSPPHFLEIGVESLEGDGECVGTLSFVCAFCLPPYPPPPTPPALSPPSVPHPLLPNFSLRSNLIFPF